jgi:hypothetical protein
MYKADGGAPIGTAVLLALALLTSAGCGGGAAPMPVAGAEPPQSQSATAADFTLTIQPETYAVTDEVREIAMSVEDLGEQVKVRVDIRGATEMHAFFASLDFDPRRFDPVEVRMRRLEVPADPLGPHIELIGAHEYGRRWLLDYRT